jgi:hypothetical protein
VYSHIPPDFLLGDDFLVQIGRCAPCELVIPLFLDPLVRLDIVSQQLRGLSLFDHTYVHVASRAQIVEYACFYRLGADMYRLIARAVFFPLGLEDGHGGEGAGAHGHVRELVGGAVGVNGEEADTRGVDAGDDEVGADMSLVAEKVLFQHGHDGDDAWGPAGGQRVEFEVRGDEGGGEFGVGRCAGAGAEDRRRDVVEFFTVLMKEWEFSFSLCGGRERNGDEGTNCVRLDDAYLVSYYGATGCSCVCCYLWCV